MKNISFDNPYLLLLIIPFLLLVLVPYFIAIRRDNKTRATVISLIIHTVIVVITALAVAGTTYTVVVTRTEVVVVADVSYSDSERLGEIDGYIEDIEDSLIGNSHLAVLTFAADSQLLVPFDENLVSVSDSTVDNTATDIVSALERAGELFSDNSIKRVVLITDSASTEDAGGAGLVQVVDNLFARDVRVDAIYLDNNVTEDDREVQISSVDVTASTYHGHESSADLLVNSSRDTRAILTLLQNGTEISVRTVKLDRGFNILNIDLPTDVDGTFDYTVTVNAEEDTSQFNNSYSFTQRVSGDVRVLLVTSTAADIAAAERIYGDNAVIDAYNVTTKDGKAVPYTVEALAQYDEILISSTDVRELNNYTAFINSVDTVVSMFGKSLVTFGNNDIQNKTDDVLIELQNMLPVNYGNSERDAKLMTIVLDMSRSMELAYRLYVEKEIAKSILDLLEDDDRVAIVAFWGENYTVQLPTPASNRDEIKAKIDALEVYQGTMIGSALERAHDFMRGLDYSDKQLVLISDGLSYIKTSETDTVFTTAANMRADGIAISTVNVFCQESQGITTMKRIAEAGSGKYYYIENSDTFREQFLTEVADDLTESVIERETEVHVARPGDHVLDGIDPTTIPKIYGFASSKAKQNAKVALIVKYERASGGTVDVPFYAYWDYGNGKVSTFATSLSGVWVDGWQDGTGLALMQNVATTNVPEERVDHPFGLSVVTDASVTTVELVPVNLKRDAIATLTITSPSGDVTEHTMIFDSTKYYLRFSTEELGKYTVSVSYSYSGRTFLAERALHVSYYPEYDRFSAFTDTPLIKAIRNRGEVTEGRIPPYSYEDREVTSYDLVFTLPLLIAAVALFVIDVIIRKIKPADIKGLFKKISRTR